MEKHISILIFILLLTGCADAFLHDYEPTLNTPYASKTKYDKDIVECRKWGKLTPRESARVDQNYSGIPLLELTGSIQLATLDSESRDNDRRRSTSVINNINVCMERRGYAVNEMDSRIPGGSYP